MNRWIIAALLAASVVMGCGESESQTPAGYWEGSGKSKEIMMDDTFRNLWRSADFTFWFNLDASGNAVGEIELDYDAVLTVQNLPQVTAPIPGGNITLAPEVGGKMTDLDPRRRFPLIGVLTRTNELALGFATPDDARPKLEFTIRGDANVSAGIVPGTGGMTEEGGVGGARYGAVVIKIPMTPFSPFAANAPVTQRGAGVYAAHFEEKTETHAIDWSAHKVRSSERELVITAELEEALRRLRLVLERESAGSTSSSSGPGSDGGTGPDPETGDGPETEDDPGASSGATPEALRLQFRLSAAFRAGDVIALTRIAGGSVANPASEPGGTCSTRHLHAVAAATGIRIDGQGPFPEPAAVTSACGFGPIVPGSQVGEN